MNEYYLERIERENEMKLPLARARSTIQIAHLHHCIHI
jgi:hypothetical protein